MPPAVPNMYLTPCHSIPLRYSRCRAEMRKTTVFTDYVVYWLQRSRTHNPLVEGSSPSGPTIFHPFYQSLEDYCLRVVARR